MRNLCEAHPPTLGLPLQPSHGCPVLHLASFIQEAASFFHLNPCFFHLLDNFPILSQVTDKVSNHQAGKAWKASLGAKQVLKVEVVSQEGDCSLFPCKK